MALTPTIPWPIHGLALLMAAKTKHQVLVEALVTKTNRVSCTRAPALTVEEQDTQTATNLLTHNISCNFQDSDYPLPPDTSAHYNYDSYVDAGSKLQAKYMTPPLVRAARLGNKALVQILLAHRADPNTAYHDLSGRGQPLCRYQFETEDSIIPACFSCERVVQLAMEFGHAEIVHLLLDAGADVDS